MRSSTDPSRPHRPIVLAALLVGATATHALAQSDVAPATTPDAAETATLPTAKELVAKMIEFQGGEKVLADPTPTHGVGQFSVPMMNLTGSLETWSAPPNLMLVEMNIPAMGGKSIQGFNGTVGWSIDPINGAQLLDGEMLKMIGRDANLRGDLDLFKMFKSVKVTGRETFNGVDCVVLELNDGTNTSTRFIEPETGRMVGSRSIMPTPQGDISVETVIAEWKTADGRTFPADTRMRMMGMEQVMKIEKVDTTPIDPKRFELPPAIAALVAERDKGEDAKPDDAKPGDAKPGDAAPSKTGGE